MFAKRFSILLTLAILSLAYVGCAKRRYYYVEKQCTVVRTEEGAMVTCGTESVNINDGANGKDGENGTNGEKGSDGEKGASGERGERGLQGNVGETGPEGNSCTVTPSIGGATILCDDGRSAFIPNGSDGSSGRDGQDGVDGTNGTNGNNGTNGVDGQDGDDALVETLDPCGRQGTFDEVFIRLSDGQIYAIYADIARNKIHLVILVDGSYVTTDGTDCHFSVSHGQILD